MTIASDAAPACPMCGTPFAAEDISRELWCAVCQTCNTVRDLPAGARLAATLASPPSVAPVGSPAAPPSPRARPAMPASLELVEGGETRQLRWRRSIKAPLSGLLFWALLPAGLVVTGCAAEHAWDRALERLVALPQLLLETLLGLHSPILGAMAVSWFTLGLALAYLVLANAKNFTTLDASGGKVEVHQGPWPVPWRRTLETPDQALYLEAWLEQLLDLRDVPVKGEFKTASASPK